MNTKALNIVFFVILMAAAGCKTAPKSEGTDTTIPNTAGAIENMGGDSDSGQALGLQTVNFPYDSYTLESDSKAKLDKNAKLLKENSKVQIQVEGHCDARGGIQYNLALGEKRANAVRNFLTDKGISKDRVKTISFGKEKLLDAGSSEDAHAKNRRANFVVTQK